MVGYLQTCGLLCALLTALHVLCESDLDYQCHVSAPDLNEQPKLETCDQAFYRLHFSFSEDGSKGPNKLFLEKYANTTINYTIELNNQDETHKDIIKTTTFKGIPSTREKPLDFITKHIPDLDRIGLTLKLPVVKGNATGALVGEQHEGLKFDVLLENHFSGLLFEWKGREELRTNSKEKPFSSAAPSPTEFTGPRYPRCVAFMTNSAKPIYGGCITELGFALGSNVCAVSESVGSVSIVSCAAHCFVVPGPAAVDPETSPLEDPQYDPCARKVIENAKTSAQFLELLKQQKPTTTTKATTNDPNDPEETTTKPGKNTDGNKNEKETSSTHKATSPAPSATTNCQPDSGAQTGLIVGMVAITVLMLVAVAGNVFQILRARKLSAEHNERAVAVKAWEMENIRLNKEIDVLRPLCGLEDDKDTPELFKSQNKPTDAV